MFLLNLLVKEDDQWKVSWKQQKYIANMSVINISIWDVMNILGNLLENSRIPSLENNFKEMGQIA